MKTILVLFLTTLALHAQRTVVSLDTDWRFHLGDIPAATAPDFDDSNWRTLDLPHDWAFEAGVSEDGAQLDKGGYYPGGIGWYRKTFVLSDEDIERRIVVEFDGVYMNSEVWLNGHKLGKFPYGYLKFSHDLTPYLKPGTNVLTVRCDNSKEPSARWYHPCGIYAPVRLVSTHPELYIGDVFVTTPEVTEKFAVLEITTEHYSMAEEEATALSFTVLDAAGEVVVQSDTGEITIKNPKRWDTKVPHLYTLVTRLSYEGKVVDEVATRFGIRTVEWKPRTGFWLNGVPVKLRGVCEHWEGGPVGGAWTPDLMRWKLRALQSMGCNAIRAAHNPCPPFFYDLCDELGILVMDEIFDGWMRKAPHDYGEQAFAEHWERDLRSWLKRDRNHPCVVIWSLGNETRGPVAPDLVKVCHEVDPTRLVTSGHSGSEHMDVFGVNGHSEKQSFYTESHRPKDKAFVATEAPHTWQVRGYYRSRTWFRDGFPNKRQAPFPLPDLTEKEIFTYDWTAPANKTGRKQIFNSSYDNAMVRITARKNWELTRDLPWFSGHFRWTGFDYPGEAGYVHGGWPFRAFMGGTHDLAGFPKDLAYFYQSQWTDEPMVHLLPHWTHPKMKPGTPIPVWAYSNAEEVELFLNDKSLGIDRPGKKAEDMQCEWMVPWQPGTLTAIARKDGKEVARTTQTTAGPPAALKLSTEKIGDTRIVTTAITDRNGILAPYADNRVHYHIVGPARVLSHENGNPVDTDNGVTGTSRRAFMGLTRSLIELPKPHATTYLTAWAILGSRNGVTDPRKDPTVTLVVAGEYLTPPSPSGSGPPDFTIHYTTDGSEPDTSSPRFRYSKPFPVTLPTTVKVLVLRNGRELFRMEERFAEDEGLYWSDGMEPTVIDSSGGMQAESAKLSGGAKIVNRGDGFRGKGFVDLPRKGAGILWYQENDGSAGEFTLRFRYTLGDPRGARTIELFVNGRKVKNLKVKSTGSWDGTWKELEIKVPLGAGANEIHLQAGPTGGPSVDELVVE